MSYTVPGRAPLAVAPTQQKEGAQRMDNLLVMLGRLAGIAGVVLCLVAGLARVLGQFYLGGFSVASLLQAGMGGLLIGCFLLLLAMHQRD
jgi:hypothetical protein